MDKFRLPKLACRFFGQNIRPLNSGILLITFILGFWRTDLVAQPTPLEILAGDRPARITLSGQVLDEVTIKETSLSFPLRITHFQRGNKRYRIKDRVKVISYLPPSDEKTAPLLCNPKKPLAALPGHDKKLPAALKPGSYLKITGDLAPASSATNPGQRSLYWDAKIKGQAVCLFARPEQIEIAAHGPGDAGSAWDRSSLKANNFFSFSRRAIMDKIRKIFPADLADLFGSFLLGTSVATPSTEISDVFRKTGLTHLLVVSGFHLSVLGGVILGTARWLGLSGLSTFLTVSLANLFMTLLCGGGPSILRATFMNQITALGNLSGRPRHHLNSFSLSAFILLLIQPLFLFQPGWQLSYAATGALLFFSPALADILSFLPLSLGRTLGITLAPVLLTLPIIAFHFSQLSLVSPLANLIILPLSEIVLVGGAAATAVSFLWFGAGQLLGQLVALVLGGLQQIVHLLSRLPFASRFIPRFTWEAVLLYYLGLGQAMKFSTIRKAAPAGKGASGSSRLRTLLGPLPLVIIGCLVFWQLSGALPAATTFPHPLTVTFLDVGQGDSCLIETPAGQKILVDGGGRLETSYAKTAREKQNQDKLSLERSTSQARLALIPALAGKGINTLDLVILTHPDEDHLGGLLEVLRQFKVKQIWQPAYAKDTAVYAAWQKLIKDKNIPAYVAAGGGKIDLEKDLVLELLNPLPRSAAAQARFTNASPRAPPETDHSFNNDSLAFVLIYKNFRLFMAGDIEEPVEKQILARYPQLLKASVIKIAHHGSKTSTSQAFLEVLKPKIAVISVGARNRFGHPSQTILERLKTIKARIFRTDQNGAVQIQTDGRQISLKTWRAN